MTGRILVINPNSNPQVTAAIAAGLEPLRRAAGPAIDCLTLEEGPFGIESQADVDRAGALLTRLVTQGVDADALVIACFSDPSIAACRRATTVPVFGIQESAVLTALARGQRYGIIALAAASIRRHRDYLDRLGLLARCAGERAADLSVAETTGGAVFDLLATVGRDLRDRDGADVVILGCAGMAGHRAALETKLGIPVIDPSQAAVAMALGQVLNVAPENR